MNNQNDSNQPPEPRPESDWAEFIEQQGQTSTPDSQPQLPFSLDDLDSQQLDDLQLDGQLRMLGRLSALDDSFVDDVLAQAQTQVDSAADTNSKSRLPVIAPVFASETPDSAAASHIASQDDQLNEQKLSPDSQESFLPHKAIATLVSVATAITVGLLIWGIGGDNSTSSNAGSQNNPNLANSCPPKRTDGSVDPSHKSISPTPPTNEAIAVHPIPDLKPETNDDQHLAPPNSIAEAPQQHPPVPIDDKNLPQRELQPPRGSVEIVEADPIPRLQWHLTVNFQKNGLGSITLNDQPITGSLLVDNADFVLRQLSDELTRRVQFFEARLGSEISASVNIGSIKFPFKNINELESTIERVCKHFKTLESSNLSIGEFAELRKSIRQLTRKNPAATSSIALSNRQIAFSTEDEVFTICSVLAASESALQDTARQRLAWEKRQNQQAPLNLPANSITPEAFTNFAANGHLVLSTPKNEAANLSSIQNLGEQELKAMLYTNVGSFDLFTNTREFRIAEQTISRDAQRFQALVEKEIKKFAKAPEEDKPKLTEKILVQVDRTELESKKYFQTKDILAQGLPLVLGDECRSSNDNAIAIDWVSNSLGSAVNQFDPSLGSRDPSNNDAFRIRELKKQLKIATDAAVNPQRLKTSDQILQIDHPRMRLELIEALEKSETDIALKLLAKRAIFDLVPEVRLAATTALARSSREQYREELLAGLKYPWYVIAQHSAEALVRLDDKDAIPELVAMLDLPHPKAPVQVGKNKFVKPELVAINHMRNCLLCHAPAGSPHDIATGVVPSWGKRLPKQYYKSDNPHLTSVRADVTYLEQDFSVVQPVIDHGLWPRDQRFDYVVQQKPIKRSKANQLNKQFADTPNRNREAIVFALQKLTNETPKDNSSESWKAILQRRKAM